MANPPSVEPFASWIDAIVRGDVNAFGQFYDSYSLRLYKLALLLTRGNEDLAKEVHQITMIKAARGFKRFQEECEIWPWLRQIARNTYLDHIRKETVISRLRSLLSIEPTAPEALHEEVVYECLERALATLELEDSTLLNAAYFGNQTQNEIALALDKSPKAIERRLSRIRQELRAILLKELQNE